MMISRVRAGSARSHTPGATRLRPYPSDSLAVTLKDTCYRCHALKRADLPGPGCLLRIFIMPVPRLSVLSKSPLSETTTRQA
jgi:hypothetical protein